MAREMVSDAAPVNLSFANADVVMVINAIGQITGRNFIIDPRVSGTISIVTHTPIAADAAYRTFLAALRVHGFTAIEGDGFTRVLPAAEARSHGVAVGAAGAHGSQLITRVFKLQHELAMTATQTIAPLLSQKDAVTAIPESNLLVVTDFADSLNAVERVLARLDEPRTGAGVIPLHYAVASDLAATLNRFFADGQAGEARGLRIVPEQRTNSLVVSAPTVGRLTEVRALVDQLDRPGAGGNVHVVYLQNAEAARLAETLNAIVSNGSADAGGEAGTSALSNAAAPLIKADSQSNSLIIVASDAVYRNLRGVIDRLDRRRAQVYIEALIAEVSSEKAAEIGIQWQTTNLGQTSTALLGGTNFGGAGRNIIGAAQNIGGVARGMNLMVGRGSVSITVGNEPVEVFNLGLLARFLEADTRSNILSTPTIVTLDNEEASIVVGRNLPFVTGRYTSTGSGSTPENPFQTIERRDVGLTLRVKPQISEGGTVRLEIFQEVSSVVPTVDQSAGPVTNKRSITTNVLVDDGSILALGGLVEDRFTTGEERVPVLGDLPVAGNLFRYRNRERVKTNLIVFLRPVILRDEPSYVAMTGSRYDYVIGLQDEVSDGVMTIRGEGPAPRLPPHAEHQGSMEPWPPAPVREASIVPAKASR